MALAYLLDPCEQYQNRAGVNNVNGYFEVFISGTDDHATVYTDFNGTLAPEHIGIDLNGRAVMIVDSALTYRVEMYEPNGHMVFSQYPVWTQKSGGGVSGTNVISTDGSIQVDKYSVGSMTTYDIGMAPADSDEFLEWVKCSSENIANGNWYPVYVEGSMETYTGQGLHVGAGKFYHMTATVKVDPTGSGVNYETLSANLEFNDGTETTHVTRRNFDIDNSCNDPVLCEFSYDFKPGADGYVYLDIEGVNAFEHVSVELQVHRIYSGINAVPDTCATKQWVEEYYSELSRDTQSDWTENDSTKPSYIKHRPDLSLYVTDSELETILEGYVTAGDLQDAIADVRQVPASMWQDANKVLTVDSNGNPAWTARGSDLPSYSASDSQKSLAVNYYGQLEWAYRLPGQVFVIPEDVYSEYNNIPGWSWTSFRASIDANVASGTPMMVLRQSDSNHPAGETAFYYHATHDSRLSEGEWVYVFGTVIAKDKYDFDQSWGGPRDVPMPGQVTYTFYKYGEDNVRVSIENKPIMYCPSMDGVQDGSVLIADIRDPSGESPSTAALRWERRQDVPVVDVDYRYDLAQHDYVLSTDINTIWSSVVTEIVYGRTPALNVLFDGGSFPDAYPYYGRHRFIVGTTYIREDYSTHEYYGSVVFTANEYDQWNGTWSNYSGILSKSINGTPTLTWQAEQTPTIGTVTV